ncbi:hypothetical protein GIW81_02105 [Hyphomicrobium sp. xq]|uniref:Uncharacterized protein n=1 Tax=Hyphomicrobium album TaxID=2665159 RepID=A0A6I3KFI9_9HYPH|nr:hypothetical protein [Hyphomicrobium album]MTD93123.1 hypothetical protein [Hyphomicrobium album]
MSTLRDIVAREAALQQQRFDLLFAKLDDLKAAFDRAEVAVDRTSASLNVQLDAWAKRFELRLDALAKRREREPDNTA